MEKTLTVLARLAVLITAFAFAVSPATLRAGEDEHGHAEEETSEHGARAEVRLSPEQRQALGIEVRPVGPGQIDSEIELLGEVHPNGDQLAHIVPRFPGLVREVWKTAGDHVRSGDVLAVIESSDSLASYELKTLIDGIVLSRHLTRGEAVDRDKQVFLVADLSTVWVDLSVYQKDLSEISVGQAVRIHAVQEGPDAEGTISYITPVVDPVTRTATARAVLPNPERKWFPGMFVTAHTLDPRGAAVAIPPSALQMLADGPVVFVETPDGFVPRVLTLGRQGETFVEVVRGLAPGERIAVKNTFLLKAELAKGEAEHEH